MFNVWEYWLRKQIRNKKKTHFYNVSNNRVYDILISTFTKTDFTLPSKKVGPAWKKRADTGLQILSDNKILYDI